MAIVTKDAVTMENSEELRLVIMKLEDVESQNITNMDVRVLETHSHLGFPDASLALGYLFEHGVLVEKDTKRAFEANLLAWKQGSSIGAYNLGILSQQEGRQNDAKTWFETAANQGDSNAKICLAEMYLENPDNVSLKQEANRLFHEAVTAGNAEACYRLAKHVQNAILCSDSTVTELLKKACLAGHADSCYMLGGLLWEAGDVNSRLDARHYFDCSAKLGDTLAIEVCVELFAFGNSFGLPRDVPKALEYLSQKAIQDNARALYVLACLTAEGEFVPRDIGRARQLAKRSLELGCELAQQLLTRLDKEELGKVV